MSDFVTGLVVGQGVGGNAGSATGVVVHVNRTAFSTIVARMTAPLVVFAEIGGFKKSYRYLTSYKGIGFVCDCHEPLTFPKEAELIKADSIGE